LTLEKYHSANGVAMNIDEYVPTIKPTNIVKAKPSRVGPPKNNRTNKTTSVVKVVLTDLDNVSFILLLKILTKD
jgi:hypothetical protein